MQFNPHYSNKLLPPVHHAYRKWVWFGLMCVSVMMIVMMKKDVPLITRLHSDVANFLTPALAFIVRPIDSINDYATNIKGLWYVYEENQQLRAQNKRLQEWKSKAFVLEAENQALRSLTNFVVGPRVRGVSTTLVADSGGGFAHSILLNAGHSQGVRSGQIAVTGDGLVGQIITVGRNSARALLLSDFNSKIPVIFGKDNYRAILSGDNTENPRLEFVPAGASFSVGDLVMTSGHGGVFPPRIPVGRITNTRRENTGRLALSVSLFAKRDTLDIVRVISEGEISFIPYEQSSSDELTPPLIFGAEPAADGATGRQ